MGGCCSCADDPQQTVRDENERRNPLPPYADWVELMRADWGSDPTAVTRDLPRMRIRVAGTDITTGPATPRLATRKVEAPTDYTARNEGLKTVLIAMCQLTQEGGSERPRDADEREESAEDASRRSLAAARSGEECAKAIAAAWDECVQTDALVHSPDVSSGLAALFKKTDLYPQSTVDGVNSNNNAHNPLSCPAAFNVMLCFAQGIVFYPTQRMGHLLWTPWAPRLRDVGWTVTVGTDYDVNRAVRNKAAAPAKADASPAEAADTEDTKLVAVKGRNNEPSRMSYGTTDTDVFLPLRESLERGKSSVICVTHTHTVRNYVDPDDAAGVPQFEVEWAFTIFLDRATGAWSGATLESPIVRAERPSSKLQKLRMQSFTDMVFNNFGVEVSYVAKLK